MLLNDTYSGARYPYVPTTLVVEISPSFAFPTSFANPKSEIWRSRKRSKTNKINKCETLQKDVKSSV